MIGARPRPRVGRVAAIVMAAALCGCSAGRALEGGMGATSGALDMFWSVRAAGAALSWAADAVGATDETGTASTGTLTGDEPPPTLYGAE